MRVCVLASSSSGNVTLVDSGRTKVLVDAGLSGGMIERLLDRVGVDPGSLEAILVSHEHRDHVKGVGVLARRYRIPVYFNSDTFDAAREIVGNLPSFSLFETGRPFYLGDLLVETFHQPHDAADPVGFVLAAGRARVGVATDLGKVTGLVKEKLASCQVAVLESNHDEKMLINGPYSWSLKQRIKSERGHLSNRNAGRALVEIIPRGVRHVFLAHLSRENNKPDLAFSTVKGLLDRAGINSVDLLLTHPEDPSKVVEI